jgi:hypothetical protein
MALALLAASWLVGCGSSSPTGPTPPPQTQPPANNQPVIESITLRNTRARAPENFADVSDPIDVSAQVRDDETPVAQLQFQWSASNGTFAGTGATVTWSPDAAAQTPAQATITLRVAERYGHPGGALNFEHAVTRTASIRLHHSAREVGEMSRRFLTEFSKPQTNRDLQDIMKDFNASACPQPGEVDAERRDVINHYTNFEMHDFEIGQPSVILDFGGVCALNVRGDACVGVPVFWDSTDKRDNTRGRTSGISRLTAAYSTSDSRWWLCSSRFQATTTLGHTFYSSQ